MTTQQTAKSQVRELWRAWSKDNSTASHATDKLLFYSWLQKHHPDALSFKCKGDKWQVVNGWLESF